MSRLDEVESTWDQWGCGRTSYEVCELALEQARTLATEVDELKRRLDAVVVGKPETDIAKAIDGALYLVMFAHLFGGIPETLHFRSISDGEWFWSKYPPNEGGPLYGKSNTVLWFAEIRAVAIAEGRDNG